MRPDAAGDTRTRVRALLAIEEAGGSRPTDTQVAVVVGSKPRRAQELLRELRAEQQRIGGELRTAQQQADMLAC